MRSTSITVAKSQLSALLDEVRAGDTIVIADRGQPVARLSPVTDRGTSTGRLERLTRAGLVKPSGRAGPARELPPPPTLTRSASAVEALIAERAASR